MREPTLTRAEKLALLLVVVLAASMWQSYDVSVFRNWVTATMELGITRIYLAHAVLGWSYRVVYPPLAPTVFVASYLAGYQVYQAIAYTTESTSLGELVHSIGDMLLKLLVKLPLIVALLVLWRTVRRLCGRRAGALLLAGPPTLSVIAPYNFDVFMALFLVLAVLSLYERKTIRAGALTAIALLFKQPAALAAPALALYTLRAMGVREAAKYVAAIAVTSAVILAPFALHSQLAHLLDSIAGFHTARLPQGPTLWAALLPLTSYNIELVREASSLWILAFATLYSLPLFVHAARGRGRPEQLAAAALLAYLAAGKVVNPAYLFWAYPLILYTAYTSRDRRMLAAYLLASMIPAAHFTLLYLSTIAAKTSLFIEEEQRWYPYTKALEIVENSLAKPLAKPVLLLAETPPLATLLACIASHWSFTALALALAYTLPMLYTYKRLLTQINNEKTPSNQYTPVKHQTHQTQTV